MQSVDVYQDSHDSMQLEEFVIEYRPLVNKIARYIKYRLPSNIELDDLLQAGLIGLLEARKSYKDDEGSKFETYASIRIRGSIIDSLRKNMLLSRDAIKDIKKISKAISTIEQRYQRQPSVDEIAQEAGVSIEEYFRIIQETNYMNTVSIDEVDLNHSYLGDESENPEKISQDNGIKTILKDAIVDLPEKEQQILSLYYVDEFKFKQIGEILNLTEARISQLHNQAISRLRIKIHSE